MKSIVISITLVSLILLSVQAQEFVFFEYDMAGNRIYRYFVSSKEVEKLPDSLFPVFGSDGFYATVDTTPALQNDNPGNAKLYPNPTKKMLTLELSKQNHNAPTVLVLYSSDGSLIYEKQNLSAINEIDIGNLRRGIYFISISIDGSGKSWKVIKQ